MSEVAALTAVSGAAAYDEQQYARLLQRIRSRKGLKSDTMRTRREKQFTPAKVAYSGDFSPGLTTRPHLDALIGDAYHVVAAELKHLKEKTEMGERLTATEAQQYERYVKSLKQLASEEREQRRADEAGKLTDAELFDVVAQLVTAGKAPAGLLPSGDK